MGQRDMQMTRTILSFTLALGLAVATTPAKTEKPLAEKVRHELVMLPYYNVFDNLAFRVDGAAVTLLGQVTDPVLATSAVRAVERISGVAAVKNEMEVLPLSPLDNRIRLAMYRAIYSYPAYSRLRTMAVPPVHIIVKYGQVTLEGVAPTKTDAQVAYLRAMSVPGVFSVTNNLAVESAR